jgi:hypothetical protein
LDETLAVCKDDMIGMAKSKSVSVDDGTGALKFVPQG